MIKFLKNLLCPRDYPKLSVDDSYIAVLDDMQNLLFYVQSHCNSIKKSSVDKMANQHALRLERESKTFKVNDRVSVNEFSGFHVGATGIVQFVEPSGKVVWVLRDGASTPCWFRNAELDILPNKKRNSDTKGLR